MKKAIKTKSKTTVKKPRMAFTKPKKAIFSQSNNKGEYCTKCGSHLGYTSNGHRFVPFCPVCDCDAAMSMIKRHRTQRREEVRKPYQVFYKRYPNFEGDQKLKKKEVLDLNSFAYVTTVHATSLDDAYLRMQGENWSPNGEARPLIKMLGLKHTSMSVGDCLYDPHTKEIYQCMDIGWEKVK
jgi:hypothetical protein